jgi:hypothetical protein
MMNSLSKNWLTENLIDFEYKKYVLLAYLQHVSENFTDHRLYPYLSDLIGHYRNLKTLKENKNTLFEKFPERASSVDFEQFKIIYEKMVQDDFFMREIESIIDFSLPVMEQNLAAGKKVYDFIEEHIRIFPVGIVPLNKDCGYLFLLLKPDTETKVYEYQISIFENPIERFRSIHITYKTSYEKNITNTFEAIKSDLLRFNKNLPNPAAFVIETELPIPFHETFLPMAKRTLVRTIAGVA